MFGDKKDDKFAKPAPQSQSTPVSAPTSVTTAPAVSTARSGPMAAIGATIRIKGDVSGEENLLIEGTVEGTVNLGTNEVVIGQNGKVTADVTAKIIKVQGTVQGDITGNEYVLLTSTSNVKGNVVTPRMTLEDGARFKGSIEIDPDLNVRSGGFGTSSKPASGSSRDDKPGLLGGEIA